MVQPKSTEVAPISTAKNALQEIAGRLQVNPESLKETLKATVIKNASDAEFMSFVIVANNYRLNPVTREIFAFPDKRAGVIPIVSTDGWTKLMVNHKNYLSHDFKYSDDEMQIDKDAKMCPKWCEIVINKKDGSAITIREYLDEVYRPPLGANKTIGPWQTHTKRMLRHKTKIQGAREAFGSGGIYDEDEAYRIKEQLDRDQLSKPPGRPEVVMPKAIAEPATFEKVKPAAVPAPTSTPEPEPAGQPTGPGPSQGETGEKATEKQLGAIHNIVTKFNLEKYQLEKMVELGNSDVNDFTKKQAGDMIDHLFKIIDKRKAKGGTGATGN